MICRGVIVETGEDGSEDPDALKLLIVKDSRSRSTFAHAVPQKGTDEKHYSVDMVVEDVLWLCCSQAILKSDN